MIIPLINSVGQRRVSKFLLLFSILISIFLLLVKFGTNSPLTINFWTGLFLMSAPVGFLCLASHNTKQYRLICIGIQFALAIINATLFAFDASLLLFILTLAELALSIIFYVVIKLKPDIPTSKVSKNNKKYE